MWIRLICLFLQFRQAELADKELLFEKLSKKEEDILKGSWSFYIIILEQEFALFHFTAKKNNNSPMICEACKSFFFWNWSICLKVLSEGWSILKT